MSPRLDPLRCASRLPQACLQAPEQFVARRRGLIEPNPELISSGDRSSAISAMSAASSATSVPAEPIAADTAAAAIAAGADVEAGPWGIYFGVAVDLFSDGVIIGAGSLVNPALGLSARARPGPSGGRRLWPAQGVGVPLDRLFAGHRNLFCNGDGVHKSVRRGPAAKALIAALERRSLTDVCSGDPRGRPPPRIAARPTMKRPALI